MSTRSARSLSRHYAKLAIISSVPLIILILALAYIHYSEQRLRRLDTLMVDLQERHQQVEGALSAMAAHTFQMRQWMEYHLASPNRRLSPTLALLTVEADPDTQSITGYFLDDDADALRSESTGNFLGNSLALAGGSKMLSKASLALEIFAIQQLGHVANSFFLYSYFLDGRENFLTIYPASDRYDFQTLSSDRGIHESVEIFFRRGAYRGGVPKDNHTRTAYWVASERDGVRGRAVVSRAAPVYEGDQFVGIVGVDVLLSHFASLLKVEGLPGTAARVVDGSEDAIAYIGGAGTAGHRAMEKISAMAGVASQGFETVDGWYLLRMPLRETGWHLDYAVPASEVHAGLAWRYLPYGLILCGVIATLIFGQLLVRAQFVRPVLSFAQYLRDGALGERVPAPDLPRVWKPWVSILRATFRRNNEALAMLRASEDRYRRLVELSPDAVMLHDADGITFLNPAGCRVLGLAGPDDAIGRSYMDFVAESDKEAAQKRVLTVIEQREEIFPTERAITTLGGVAKDIEIMATPFLADDGSVVALVIFRDITSRKVLERAIRESEGRFRAISEAIPLPVLISDAASLRVSYANPAARDQLSASDEFLDGASLFDLGGDRGFRKGVLGVVEGRQRVASAEFEVRRADGTRFWARTTTVPMVYQGQDSLIHAIVDLTERIQVEAEIARQRESFHQKEKIAALGSLLAGLAHELNNPLSVVSGQSLMLEEAVDDEGIVQRAQRIREAAERCSRTVRTFLAMARSKAPERAPVSLNEVVRSSLDLVSYGLQSSGVEAELDLDDRVSDVTADADQLHHLISNLILNAEHALRESSPPRTLTISTRVDTDGRQVRLSVADNGPGVPPEIVERIFEPFFTTKPGAAGTGIGLSLCRDIVSSHGGKIAYSDNEPRGAVFTIVLPLADGRAIGVRAQEGSAEVAEIGNILVVDDDEEVALTLADVLRGHGHEVDTVFGAGEGIERARHNDYDIIISDVRMPGAGGPDLYRALESEIDGLDHRMMFMTGDTLRTDLDELVSGTPIPVIEKPLDPRAVAALISGKLKENRREAAGR